VPLLVGVGVVAALLATGVISPHRSSGSLEPFSQAEATSLQAASFELGGAWETVGALGFDDRAGTSLSATDLAGYLGPNCTATPLLGGLALPRLVIPPYRGSFGSGLAPVWIVLLTSTDHASSVVVDVANGTALPVAEIGGAGCSLSGASVPTLPSHTVDSPTIAAEAWNDLGKSWVAVEPNLTTVTLAAFAGGSFQGFVTSGLWATIYAPCNPLIGGSSAQTALFAAFNLTDGSLSGSTTHTVDCP
jgi:hypothetical protein